MQKRILIVDDEDDTITVYARLLRRFDCEIEAVQTLHDAKRVMAGGRYHIILTDLRLTGSTGEEGLEILRVARNEGANTEVIVVTGYGNPAVMSKAYQLGAAYYFEKPIKPLQLLDAMEELCR